MKDREEIPKPLAYSVMLLIVICLLIAIFSPVASAQVVKPLKMESGKEYHLRLQKVNSWETYQSNRIKAAKDRKKAKKEQSALSRREEKLRAKIRRIEG